MTLVEQIRTACAWVAGRATHVTIDADALAPYAAALPGPPPAASPEDQLVDGPPELRAAFHLTLDAINFGSGWFPTLRKRDGRSGYWTVALAERLARWDCFTDASPYQGRRIPFFKRAQIAASDLHHAGVADFAADLHRLTLFADNLVPHALRLDGILRLDPALTARIEAGELLAHDSPEEVELRACAVHAVELIVSVRPDLTAQRVDHLLWTKGGGPTYKAVPRPRCRCTAY